MSLIQEDLKNEFKALLKDYSTLSWITETNYFIEFFLRTFIQERGLVLDVGSGIGCVSAKIGDFVAYLIGVDLNVYALRYAKSKGWLDNPIAADARHLPFKERSFDLIIMREVIEHLQEPLKALIEINRTLKGSGKLILTTPNGLYVKILHHRPLVSPTHITEYTWFEIKKLLKEAGFYIVSARASNLPCLSRISLGVSKKLAKLLGKLATPFTVSSFYIAAEKTFHIQT